ncbi:hypothetical protein [Acetobacter malorum]|uniref:Uncharacterized protein n=1 Tax=Acetobacter malorum TaxID=178901 RepID=A0A1Y3GBH6_9PROT|nr:hypothetical protein [Acetobacter malorum]OUJ05899.1 hypothetical protein HK23_03350 [Acetobacter malorum]
MLHAFNQKGVRRVLCNRHEEHTNNKNEDAITSMVFSPLAFMRAVDAWLVVKTLLGPDLLSDYATRHPNAHEIQLWPNGLKAQARNGDSTSRCEPDLVMQFQFDDIRSLIITWEMKWTWIMATNELLYEIVREQEAIKKAYPRSRRLIVALTQTAGPIKRAGVINIRWTDVHRIAHQLKSETFATPVREWGKQVSTFLEKAKQISFSGFHTLSVEKIKFQFTEQPK